MSCNNVQNKLREQKGASLAMALFLLIVVTIVATIMINSAYSNAGRVRRNIKAEQNYLAVNSAAELVKSYLSGVTMTCVITETEGSDTDGEGTATEYGYKDDPYGTVIFVNNIWGTNPKYVQGSKGSFDEAAELYISGNGKAVDSNVYPASDAEITWKRYNSRILYFYDKNVIVEKNSGTTTSTEYKYTLKDSVSNIEHSYTTDNKDKFNSVTGNPFAVKLMNWFNNNISTNDQKTENNIYTITVKNEDDIADVNVTLSISGTNFSDANDTKLDKVATYIVVSLSLAEESSSSSGSSTGSDGTIKKNGNENYYMSITIPFTATKDVTTTGSKAVSDPEGGISLSSLYDEDTDSYVSFDDYSDDADYDEDADAQADSTTTVTTTTYTVNTASASGASNNVDVEKGELDLASMSKNN